MKVISLPRGQGKTTQLIKMSAETGIPILVASKNLARILMEKAQKLNLTIESVLFLDSKKIMQYSKGNNDTVKINNFDFNIDTYNRVYVDEFDCLLNQLLGLDIDTVTVTEDNPTTQETNISQTLFQNLTFLLKKYGELIQKNDIGGALNVMKNIDMVASIIRDINSNESFQTCLNGLAKCWDSLENQKDVEVALAGKKDFEITTAMIEKLKTLNQIEGMCINENLYYCESLAESLLKCSNTSSPILQYKKFIKGKQYEGKTYKDTIIEMNKEIK